MSEPRNDFADVQLAAEKLIALSKHTIPAIVTECYWKNGMGKTWFGFRFDPTRSIKVGDLLDEGDGSMARVRAVVPGYKAG